MLKPNVYIRTCACVNVCTSCAYKWPWKPEEGARSPGARLTAGCEPTNPGHLQQQALLPVSYPSDISACEDSACEEIAEQLLSGLPPT